MKAYILQPPYSRDLSLSDEYFEYKMKLLDECDESADIIVLPEYSDVPCAAESLEDNLYYHDIIDSQIILDFDDFDVYKKILLIFFIVIIMIVLSLSFKNHKLRYLFFSSVCLLQIFIYSGWGMYYNSGYFLSDRANMAVNELDMVNSELERYKKGYQSYTPDYAFVYKVNTLDNWLHILPSKQIDLYKRLGYKNSDTCVRSYGGTIFSDWLFNVGYLIDDKLYKDESMYKYLDRYFSYYLYEYNYNNGFGLIYNKVNELGNDYDKYLFGFDLQNKMYKDLFNSDFDFIKISNNKYNVDDSGIVYKIEDLGFLYIDFYNDEVDKVVEYIKVNDQYINYDSTNYIIDLGMYDSDVKIDLGGLIYDDIEFDIGFIRYDDIMELNSNVNVIDKINNGYKLSVNNDRENGYLFLPINNISGLRAYINGNKVEIDSYMDNFVNIKLYKGNNDIEIKYEMPMLKLGIFLSIFGIICLLFFNRIPEYKIILNIIYYVYIFICIFVYLYFYGYSLFKYFG